MRARTASSRRIASAQLASSAAPSAAAGGGAPVISYMVWIRLHTEPSTAAGSRCVITKRASGKTARMASRKKESGGDLSCQRTGGQRHWRSWSVRFISRYAGVMSHASHHAR